LIYSYRKLLTRLLGSARNLDDPNHEVHQDAKDWLDEEFNPENLGIDEINARLRRIKSRWSARGHSILPPVKVPVQRVNESGERGRMVKGVVPDIRIFSDISEGGLGLSPTDG
jgi:hypothetical protein